MLDSIMNLVKDNVMNAVGKESTVPAEKKEQTVATTTEALTNGLKQNFTINNLPNVLNLLKPGSTSQSNPITGNIQNTVANALVNQVGLSQSVAGIVASTVVPMVMKAISGKMNDPNDKGFNVESLVNSLGGGTTESGSQASIMGTIGKLFG